MIEKKRRYIHIICNEGTTIKGFIDVLGEQKTIDIINNANENFVLLYDAEIIQQADARSFRLITKSIEIKSSVAVNKSVIKWISEP